MAANGLWFYYRISMKHLPERVWIIRHGETTAPHVFNGAESDVPLSPLGFQQAEALAEWFVEHRPTAVISSAMIRAVQTASPVAKRIAIPHHTEPLLHERKVGAMAGTSFNWTDGPWMRTSNEWTAGNTGYTTEGAESFDDLTARIMPAWERAIAPHAGGRVVMIVHGIVCKVLLVNLLEGWDVRGWGKLGRVSNASISEIIPSETGRWLPKLLFHVPDPVAVLNSTNS
jgi:broad specificity phosphatase PhoE